jgi:hypothetical protein
MRIRARAAMVGAWLLVALPAAAYDHNCPPAGTEVMTTEIQASGRPIRYEGQDGLWCLRSRGGRPISSELGHLGFFQRQGEHDDVFDKFLTAAAELWPITPGKETGFQYAGVSGGLGGGSQRDNRLYAFEFSVGDATRITVPAGTFMVVPIEILQRGTGGNYMALQSTYYYAPELGTNVKFDYRVVSGTGPTRAPAPWELVSIKPPSAK